MKVQKTKDSIHDEGKRKEQEALLMLASYTSSWISSKQQTTHEPMRISSLWIYLFPRFVGTQAPAVLQFTSVVTEVSPVTGRMLVYSMLREALSRWCCHVQLPLFEYLHLSELCLKVWNPRNFQIWAPVLALSEFAPTVILHLLSPLGRWHLTACLWTVQSFWVFPGTLLV